VSETVTSFHVIILSFGFGLFTPKDNAADTNHFKMTLGQPALL